MSADGRDPGSRRRADGLLRRNQRPSGCSSPISCGRRSARTAASGSSTPMSHDYSQTQITIQGLVGYQLPLGVTNLQVSATAGFRYQNLSADYQRRGPASADIGWRFRHGAVDRSDHRPLCPLRLQRSLVRQCARRCRRLRRRLQLHPGRAFGAVGYNWTKTISTSIGYRAIYRGLSRAAASSTTRRSRASSPASASTSEVQPSPGADAWRVAWPGSSPPAPRRAARQARPWFRHAGVRLRGGS